MTWRRLKVFRDILILWGVAVFFGSIVSWGFASPSSSGRVVSALASVSVAVPLRSPVLRVFFKNSLASLTTIFLGFLLCYLELRVFVGVTPNTYSFLESLTAPLYRILGAFFPRFRGLRPFFRSCFFYLYFVPYLALVVNGLALGFLFGRYVVYGMFFSFLALVSPHGFVEVPALLLSAYLGLLVAEGFRSSIFDADLLGLKNQFKESVSWDILGPVLAVQILLLVSAFLEVG